MSGMLLAAGGLLVLLVLLDVFFTVLFPSSGHGPIRKPLSWLLWGGFSHLGRRLNDRHRRWLLSYSGPTVVTTTLLAWGALLTTGWALISRPALGGAITSSGTPAGTGWATAFYYSAAVLTTLGAGKLGPSTAAYRLLQVTEAAIGLVSLTMVITYFLSVYNAITHRKTFSASLHHRTQGTGDAAVLLAGLSTGGTLADSSGYLNSMGESMLHILQTHAAYPVLRYFHFRKPRYALPRLVLIALDTASLLHAALGPTREAQTISGATIGQLWGGTTELLEEISPRLREHGGGDHGGDKAAGHCEQWRARYANALDTFRAAGIALPTSQAPGVEGYLELRARWDSPLRALAHGMAYRWEEIDPASGDASPPPPRGQREGGPGTGLRTSHSR